MFQVILITIFQTWCSTYAVLDALRPPATKMHFPNFPTVLCCLLLPMLISVSPLQFKLYVWWRSVPYNRYLTWYQSAPNSLPYDTFLNSVWCCWHTLYVFETHYDFKNLSLYTTLDGEESLRTQLFFRSPYCPPFYGTQWFITVFTKDCQWPLVSS
jgi:hypothetical protein